MYSIYQLAHCELNPIELAWASVKGYVATHNQAFTLAKMEKQIPEGLVKDLMEEFIINFGSESDDSDDDDIELDDRQLVHNATELYKESEEQIASSTESDISS